MENKLLRKGLVVGIIFLFLFSSVIPINLGVNVKIPERTSTRKIITVDDEPGDADYTSIIEALNYSNPGDTIQVYSGTYYEHDITVDYNGITLQGVPHELGSGSDTGKPVVTSTENLTIFYARGDDVTITGFVIIDGSPPSWMTFPIRISGDNCTFSYNDVSGGWTTVWVEGEGFDNILYNIKTRIIGNTIENTSIGVDFSSKYGNISFNKFRYCDYCAIGLHDQSTSNIISHNSMSNCSIGIQYLNGSDSIISFNNISAGTGIDLIVSDANNISIMKNEFQRCGTGISLDIKNSLVQIRQNNFIKNTRDIWFVQSLTLKYNLFFHRFFDGNYYDTWHVSGPKQIWEIMVIFVIPINLGEIFFFIPISILWIYLDWHPAKEPYDI